MIDRAVRATLAGILLFVIGLAIAGGAFQNYRRERERLEGWDRAEGRVAQILHLSGGASRPVVSFTASNGDHIRFTAVGALTGRAYQVGDSVIVLYPRDDPSAARLESTALRWARTIYAAAGALILMALGAYVAWYARRRDGEAGSAIE